MNVYEVVTESIIKKLESGTVPWKKGWIGGSLGSPKNYVTKSSYRGINVFLLAAQGYECPFWATFNQIRSKKGWVKQGEHGTVIVFWRPMFDEKEEDVDDPEQENLKDKKPRGYLLRYHRVFNLEQTDIDWKSEVQQPEHDSIGDNFSPIERCEEISKKYLEELGGPAFEVSKRAIAAYRRSDDAVEMPEKESFFSESLYYITLFHEFGHSTGSPKRLGKNGEFRGGEDWVDGVDRRSKEELIAEMTAAFLSSEAGIDPDISIEESSSYIAGWLSAIKNDTTMVIKAASVAQRAADHILGRDK